MKIGIIGGGMMGLATAYYLAKAGLNVTILEKENEIGGLSRSEEIMPGLRWDRFYHVILSTDEELLNFIDEIGLSLDVHFNETHTGFFTDNKLHSMSSTSEFLKFKPLNLWNKFRLGIGIIYASKLNNWRRLEKIYVKGWLIRLFGRRNYEKLWSPLLYSKLGDAKNEASAAFIWAIIKRLYNTRHSASKKEMMGTVKGGYYSILNNTKKALIDSGVKIVVDSGIEEIEHCDDGRLRLWDFQRNSLDFDRVISTIPNTELIRLCPQIPEQFKLQLQSVHYLSLICVTLVLKRSLSPFYVTNLTDPGFPFTGLIEATHIIPREILGNKGLIYLSRWLPSEDPFFSKEDNEVISTFILGLKRIFPDLKEDEILAKRINREKYVQPILGVNYSEKISEIRTPVEHFYMVNTTMITNSTLNNNKVIELARKASEIVSKD